VPSTFIGSPLRRLSKKTGERITIREYLKEVYQETKASAIKMLDQKIRDYMIKTENMKVNAKVTIGYPEDKIIEMTTEENVDLIVIGTTGLKGISKTIQKKRETKLSVSHLDIAKGLGSYSSFITHNNLGYL
jgi:1-deoxy-D-xylulose 5-phosphate reductoisomerase